jgi:hypothetical protein
MLAPGVLAPGVLAPGEGLAVRKGRLADDPGEADALAPGDVSAPGVGVPLYAAAGRAPDAWEPFFAAGLPPPPEKAQASRPSRARPAQRVITRRRQ